MAYNIDESIIAKSIKHYGAEIQSTVCMEECAELIQAISKLKRKYDDIPADGLNHLTEKIADVLICIEILKQIYDIPDHSIEDWIEWKQKRILKRMRK